MPVTQHPTRRTSLMVALAASLLWAGQATPAPAGAAEPGSWERIALPATPDPRFEHSMVAAPELGMVIVFGGLTSHAVDSDVWMIRPDDQHPSWTTLEVPPGSGPGPRQGHSAIWDPVRRRMVVFGGFNPEFGGRPAESDQDLGHALPRDGYNDVWALGFDPSGAPTGWTRLDTAPGVYGITQPLERWRAGAVYDSKRQRLIVHGGLNRQINSLDFEKQCLPSVGCLPDNPVHSYLRPYGLPDTWAFDLGGAGGWTLLDAAGPKQNSFYAGYDAANDRMITVKSFGLRVRFVEMPPPPQDADIQSFDLTTNQWTDWPDPPQIAAPGLTQAGGYSQRLGGFIALGYEWDPHPRMRLAAYRLHLDQPGSSGTRWERLPGSRPDDYTGMGANPDDPIAGASGSDTAGVLLDDPGKERIVAFGGSVGATQGLYGPVGLASYDLSEHGWEDLRTTPFLPMFRHTTVLDPQRRHLYVLGGFASGLAPGEDNPLWRLGVDGGSWETVPTEGEAPPELYDDLFVSAMAVHDPAGDRILQIAARRPVGEFNTCGDAVHALDLEEMRWERLETAGDPPRACEMSVVLDTKRRRLVLTNGFVHGANGTETRNRNVYALDLTKPTPEWSQIAVSGAEQGVLDRGAPAVYEPAGDRILQLTMNDGTFARPDGTLLVESLSFSADGRSATWSLFAEGGDAGMEGPITGGPGPAPRSYAQMILQPDKKRLVIFAGRTRFQNEPADAGTYTLSLEGTPTWTSLGTPGEVPLGRVHGAAAYDAERQRLIVFGGFHRNQTHTTRETYALDLFV